ncbi:hypothetical protein I5Q34_26220 [Streptomyces sp. AV19]|uniref:hypothetical protein n=1 Tax=Streptomyces sp. AV19 TaxID=2793068 RepID=UPI0018FE555D|nr:hypothetical protein [Streptomyces sp. AV19]MBH1937726.1 hypothetical protein [Streptomyces sp. AV19]MDG4536394.1 hypothetical protein [Streptomyces sp. AV19]
MSAKVSGHLLRRLREWGVERVFAYPGDGINGLLAAWGRSGDDPRPARPATAALATPTGADLLRFLRVRMQRPVGE